MFGKEGPERTNRDNRRLAAYLAVIAGTVNSVGFVVLGSFTSHVTGNVARFALDVATARASAALSVGAAIVAFFVGAFVTSMLIESRTLVSVARTSAALLSLEAALIVWFVLRAPTNESDSATDNVGGFALCMAMGIQNSLVTRLSGAVVRTTHLTGVVTDLGIEAARWFRYWRSRSRAERPSGAAFTQPPVQRPAAAKAALLATIFTSFVVGSVGGGYLALRVGRRALWPVAVLLGLGATYALLSGRSVVQRSRRAR
jgi:uncharacterized membrane protein YoaK (UPF0700 family)